MIIYSAFSCCSNMHFYSWYLVQVNSFPASVFEKSYQPPPAFLIIFTKFHGLQYFVVWISEHAIHQNKDQSLCFKKKKLFYSSFKHCYFSFFNQHLNVGRFHKKKQHFEQKAENFFFLSNTTSGSYSVILSKQRCSRLLPSVSQSFTGL